MALALPRPARWRFQIKTGLALLLVALADLLFFDQGAGSVLGVFALVWAGATLLAHKAIWRDQRSLILLGLAAVMAVVLAVEPSLIGWILFWSALSMAALMPRRAAFGDAWQWFRRLFLHGLTSLMGPLMDLIRITRLQGRGGKLTIIPYIKILVLPAMGGAIFLGLFTLANPVIADFMSRINLPSPDQTTLGRIIFWGVMGVTVWSSLRPRRLSFRLLPLQEGQGGRLPGVNLASVIVSLILFNMVFALQNGIDLAVMLGGVSLPQGMNYAEYAHRGAYPLIVTALLAGGFVLLATRPGTPMAASKLVKGLVIGWTAQNLVLVGFSIARTLNYIQVYSLTVLRISALLWMGLVGVGLVLITIRLIAKRSSAWLVNGNALALLTLLGGCSFVDLGEIAARTNVTEAREVGGTGVDLDLCYLHDLGSSALVPLAELEVRPGLRPEFRTQVSNVRQMILMDVQAQQADWQSWEWRDAKRLAQLPPALQKVDAKDWRAINCDGSPVTLAIDAAAATALDPASELPIDAED